MTRPALVVDASAAVYLASANVPPPGLDRYDLVAPHLLWSEALSALRGAAWREAIPEEVSDRLRARLETLPIEAHGGPDLRRRAWEIAVRHGWPKTYDAEYIALAERLGAALLTVDQRLRRGIADRVRTVDPSDLY